MNDARSKLEMPYHILVPYLVDRIVTADFSLSAYQRQPHPDAAIEASIAQTWVQRKLSNNTLFNGRKLRLAEVVASSSEVILRMGLTDYKTYLGTHLPPVRLARSFSPSNMARALGNVIILCTTDSAVPFIVRSRQSADAPLALALPGGHPEPDDIPPPLQDGDPRITALLPASARAELLEELFLSENDVVPASHFVFLGIVERIPDRKPSMVYYAQALVSADDVRRSYKRGNVLRDESVDLVIDTVHRLQDMTPTLVRLSGVGSHRPVPETLGAAALWRQMMAAA